MNYRSVVALAFFGLMLCQYPDIAHSDSEIVKKFNKMKKIPAVTWLKENKNEYALASNRFGRSSEARKFVNGLLRLGATQVYVADPMEEEWRIKKEGGPYADTLLVELPEEKSTRVALFKVFAEEAEREGFEAERDVGQKLVLLWWD